MSTRLLLEGPDIETLLVRVREEHGPGARIVAADKVRRGGIAGFFAKERYEVAVETEGAATDAPTDPPAASAADLEASLLGLAAAVDAVEASQPVPVETSPARAPEEAAARLSTDGADFAAVLADLTRSTSGPPVETAPEDVRPFVPATPAPAPADARIRTAPQDIAPQDIAEAAPENSPTPSGRRTRMQARLAELGLPTDVAAEMATALTSAEQPSLTASLARALPFLSVAPNPPAGPGEVLILLGPGAVTYEIARGLATRMRIDPASVLLVAPNRLGTQVMPSRRLSGPVECAARLERMCRAKVPSVVVVDAPFDAVDDGWVRETCEALEPTGVWAVVEASRKPADLSDQLDRLGRVDAVVVRGSGSTRDPGSVLSVCRDRQVPTALLEDRRGDAAGWATLINDRLAAQQ